jgi:hypothetical protein
MHELQSFQHSCFITLTYNDDHLPTVTGKKGDTPTLVKADFQKFMKRLRKKYGSGIRFFHCGEYGSRFGRPHYHAILFGIDFTDRVPFKNNNGIPIYKSQALQDLWKDRKGEPIGYVSVGEVNFNSVAYVARYITKKITGDDSGLHYSTIHTNSLGECLQVQKEYCTMSRRPGIGKGWFDSNIKDIYPRDEVTVNTRDGIKVVRPPKYYDSQFELINPSEMELIKDSRRKLIRKYAPNNTPERLAARERVMKIKYERLIRPIK